MFKYLARYTHRVAVANSRITAANSDSVSFRYQDYAGGHRHRIMKLDSVEFLRRFLQHVLPDRFVRIRHYGLLANRARKQKLPLCRHLIAQASGHHMITAPDLSAFLQPAGDDHLRCPVCHAGTMRRIQDFRRQPTWDYLPLRRGPPTPHDTISTTPSVRLHHALLRAAVPLLLRTRARHLPRSARQLLHPASSHAASAWIPVLFRAPQPARARTALRRHPHTGIPISIGARFSSINPIRPGPGHAADGQRSLFAGPTRIDSFSKCRIRHFVDNGQVYVSRHLIAILVELHIKHYATRLIRPTARARSRPPTRSSRTNSSARRRSPASALSTS